MAAPRRVIELAISDEAAGRLPERQQGVERGRCIGYAVVPCRDPRARATLGACSLSSAITASEPRPLSVAI